ncbi:acetolactate decarboxylase [Ruminococcus sp.]|uniref:acetolactate decarboxylase n=1 Tax=Ruminococcus sp. TaxID=41978 RepID=UPI0025EB8C19|nr:acetolactate decarboxylase [Ruminococcus sp.]MBQ8966642.1 acetolactate decarboxylase [Ruminococcus sp.]
MKEHKMFQVSTLQALALGYSKSVVTVEELLSHGDTGLGTFEDVDGEMITLDGRCYRASEHGTVTEADGKTGVPFSSVAYLEDCREFELGHTADMAELKKQLTLRIEERFGLNSMHLVRIDGSFAKVCARSESGYRAHHVSLKDALSVTQKDFVFENISGSLVGVYYPDYMDGINAAGWHMHFISDDRTKGGHVFELEMNSGRTREIQIHDLEISLPSTPAFDTYSLKSASKDEIKEVEQGE